MDGGRNGTSHERSTDGAGLSGNPSVISSGCPYCLTMLSDGTKAKEVEEKVKTYDVAELLAEIHFWRKRGTALKRIN